ncbi:MAG: hypothetical protein AAF368_11580 [Planctomycetota bacterium]
MSLTKIKGTLVDLSHFGTVVANQPEIEEWQVVLRKKGGDQFGLDELLLRLCVKDGVDREAFESRLRADVAEATEVSPNVIEFLELSEMLQVLGMETEMKEKRYLDERPTH